MLLALLLTIVSPLLDYDDAIKQAEKGTPVIIVVSQDSCPPCIQLQRSIEEAVRLGDFDGVVVTKVDANKQPQLAAQLGTKSTPHVVAYCLKEKWRKLRPQKRPITRNELVRFIKQVKETFECDQ